jgi:hypothetical protein
VEIREKLHDPGRVQRLLPGAPAHTHAGASWRNLLGGPGLRSVWSCFFPMRAVHDCRAGDSLLPLAGARGLRRMPPGVWPEPRRQAGRSSDDGGPDHLRPVCPDHRLPGSRIAWITVLSRNLPDCRVQKLHGLQSPEDSAPQLVRANLSSILKTKFIENSCKIAVNNNQQLAAYP